MRDVCLFVPFPCKYLHKGATAPKVPSKRGETSRWRVCYQQGLPRLVITKCNVQNVFSVMTMQTCQILLTPPAATFQPISVQAGRVYK